MEPIMWEQEESSLYNAKRVDEFRSHEYIACNYNN